MGEAYLSEDGITHVRYQTLRHSTRALSPERLLPLDEALDRAEKDFGAPFKAPVTDPRRVFVAYIVVRVDVPESAYALGQYPNVHMELVLDADFQADGTLDPAQRPGHATPDNVSLDIKHPVEGLRPVDRTVPLLEVASEAGIAVFIHQSYGAEGTRDLRFYWLDGDTQYMIQTPPVAGMRSREEILALVDLIASQ